MTVLLTLTLEAPGMVALVSASLQRHTTRSLFLITSTAILTTHSTTLTHTIAHTTTLVVIHSTVAEVIATIVVRSTMMRRSTMAPLMKETTAGMVEGQHQTKVVRSPSPNFLCLKAP